MSHRLTRALVATAVLTGATVVGVSAAQGGIDAEVTEKATDTHGAYVIATTDVGGLEFQRYIPIADWTVVQEGDDVIYHLHNGETEIYTWERGELLWRG